MHTYLVQVTGQSKAAWEKHYTTTTWTAFTGTDVNLARVVAREAAHGVRTVRVLRDGTLIAIWTTFGWQKIEEPVR